MNLFNNRKKTNSLGKESYQVEEFNVFSEVKKFNDEVVEFKSEENERIKEAFNVEETKDPLFEEKKEEKVSTLDTDDVKQFQAESTNSAASTSTSTQAAGAAGTVGVAATATTIAVAAIAVIMPVIVSKMPVFTLNEFEVSSNSAHVVANISDLSSDGDYVLQVYNAWEKYNYAVSYESYTAIIEADGVAAADEDNSYTKIDHTFTGLSSNTMYTLEFLEKTSGTIYFTKDFKTLKEIPVVTNTSYTFDNSLVNISYDMDVSKLNTMDYVGVYKVGNKEYELPNESLDSNYYTGDISVSTYDPVEIMLCSKSTTMASNGGRTILYSYTFEVPEEEKIDRASIKSAIVSTGLQVEDLSSDNILADIDLELNILTTSKDNPTVVVDSKSFTVSDRKCLISGISTSAETIDLSIGDTNFSFDMDISKVNDARTIYTDGDCYLLTYDDGAFNYYFDVASAFEELEDEATLYRIVTSDRTIDFVDDKVYCKGLSEKEDISVERYVGDGVFKYLSERRITNYEYVLDAKMTDSYENGIYTLSFDKDPSIFDGSLVLTYDVSYNVDGEYDDEYNVSSTYNLLSYPLYEDTNVVIDLNDTYKSPSSIKADVSYKIVFAIEEYLSVFTDIFGDIDGVIEKTFTYENTLDEMVKQNVELTKIISNVSRGEESGSIILYFDNLRLSDDQAIEVVIGDEIKYLNGSGDNIAYFENVSSGEVEIKYSILSNLIDGQITDDVIRGEEITKTIDHVNYNDIGSVEYRTGNSASYYISVNDDGTYNVYMDPKISVSQIEGLDSLVYGTCYSGSLYEDPLKIYDTTETAYFYSVPDSRYLSQRLVYFGVKDDVYYYISDYYQSGSIQYEASSYKSSNAIIEAIINPEDGTVSIRTRYELIAGSVLIVEADGESEEFVMDSLTSNISVTTSLLHKAEYRFRIVGNMFINTSEYMALYPNIVNVSYYRGSDNIPVDLEIIPYYTAAEYGTHFNISNCYSSYDGDEYIVYLTVNSYIDPRQIYITTTDSGDMLYYAAINGNEILYTYHTSNANFSVSIWAEYEGESITSENTYECTLTSVIKEEIESTSDYYQITRETDNVRDVSLSLAEGNYIVLVTDSDFSNIYKYLYNSDGNITIQDLDLSYTLYVLEYSDDSIVKTYRVEFE